MVTHFVSSAEPSTHYQSSDLPPLSDPGGNLREIAQVLTELVGQKARIDAKMSEAEAQIYQRDDLQRQCDALSGEINKKRALAFVDGDSANLGSLEASLAEARRHLRKAEISAVSSEAAVAILEKKSAKNADMMTAISGDLLDAERAWLKIKQKHLFEDFRRRFHDLHDTVALLLALEVHPSFDEPGSWVRLRAGANMLGKLADALPYKGPYNYSPDWLHINDRFAFPGFSRAAQKLADELLQTKAMQEQVE